MEKVVMTKEILDRDYELYSNKRQLRKGQVKKLLTLLENGSHFDTPMSVNRVGNKNRILDGSHRFDAMRLFFATHPDHKVVVWVMVYRLTNAEDERQKFRELNSGVKPSSDDFLQQYAESKPFLKRILSDLPRVSVYGSSAKPLKLRVLLNGYINAKKDKFGPTNYSAFDMLEMVDRMDRRDFANIRGFLIDYEEMFGKLSKENPWIRTTLFDAIFRIWYWNKERVSREKLFAKMKLLINHHLMHTYGKIGGREGVYEATKAFLDLMNRSGRSLGLVVENAVVEEGGRSPLNSFMSPEGADEVGK